MEKKATELWARQATASMVDGEVGVGQVGGQVKQETLQMRSPTGGGAAWRDEGDGVRREAQQLQPFAAPHAEEVAVIVGG